MKKTEESFEKAKVLLWEKYKNACVGFAFNQEALIYSYRTMVQIENANVNDDNLANANVYDFVKNFADEKRLVYLDENGLQEYPFDHKIDRIVEEWLDDDDIVFVEETDIDKNICNVIVSEIPFWFKFQSKIDIFLQHIENSAKYMKVHQVNLSFVDDAYTEFKQMFEYELSTDAIDNIVPMFTKNGWHHTEDWNLTFTKNFHYSNKTPSQKSCEK